MIFWVLSSADNQHWEECCLSIRIIFKETFFLLYFLVKSILPRFLLNNFCKCFDHTILHIRKFHQKILFLNHTIAKRHYSGNGIFIQDRITDEALTTFICTTIFSFFLRIFWLIIFLKFCYCSCQIYVIFLQFWKQIFI